MKRSLVLQNCRYLVTYTSDNRLVVLEDVDVVVEDGVITGVGRNLDVPRGVDKLYLREHIVMPGLVNAHTHAAMTILRGYADDQELFDWLRKVWVVESKLTGNDVYLASRLAVYEMLFSGTTCFIDMYYYYEETVRAAKEVGLRVVAGPLCQDKGLDIPGGDEYFNPIVNVHSLYRVPLERVVKCFEHARRNGVRVHIHVSETRREVYETWSKTGKFPVELMDTYNLLDENTILVHLNWVTSWEVNTIAFRRAKVVVCPSSSMKLANSGFTPIHELQQAEVTVGLGTDGACSTNKLDILDEMRQLVLLYRHNYWDTRITAQQAFQVATINGYRIAGFKTGTIEPGSLADIVVLNLRKPWMKPTANPLSLIVYTATRSDVDYVIVNGNPLLTPENKEELISKAEETWTRLESRITSLWQT